MTPSLLMVDTDIASYAIKATHRSVDTRFTAVDPSRLCVSVITQSELLHGLKRLDPDHLLHLEVRRFLQDMTILPWDEAAAEVHAEIRYRLRAVGNTFGEMDMLIAAYAISLGAILVTNNIRHFGRLAPLLTIEHWVDSPR